MIPQFAPGAAVPGFKLRTLGTINRLKDK